MKPRAWLVVACMAFAGVLFLAAYPARAYLAQNDKRREVAAEVRRIEAENGQLQAEADKLQTDAEIERLARRDYNLARPGEEVYALVPPPTTTAPPPPPPERKADKSLPERAWDWVTGMF